MHLSNGAQSVVAVDFSSPFVQFPLFFFSLIQEWKWFFSIKYVNGNFSIFSQYLILCSFSSMLFEVFNMMFCNALLKLILYTEWNKPWQLEFYSPCMYLLLLFQCISIVNVRVLNNIEWMEEGKKQQQRSA